MYIYSVYFHATWLIWQFFTQLKTVTSLWREADATVLKAATVMPTMR
jgi:hypothetical protein